MKNAALLFIIAFLLCACESKIGNTEDFKEFPIENSTLNYKIGQGTLSQYSLDTVDDKNIWLNTWKIPFINDMPSYDMFLIVEQQRHVQEYYPYKHIVSQKNNLFRKVTRYYQLKGRIEWDVDQQKPIITSPTQKERDIIASSSFTDGNKLLALQTEKKVKVVNIVIFSILLLIIIYYILLCIGFRLFANNASGYDGPEETPRREEDGKKAYVNDRDLEERKHNPENNYDYYPKY
jgi:hypothetical protein